MCCWLLFYAANIFNSTPLRQLHVNYVACDRVHNSISHSKTVTSYPMFIADCDIVISTALIIIVADCMPNAIVDAIVRYELPNRI